MARQLFSGRILSAPLAVALIASLMVSFGAAVPARAGHYLTHPASEPAAPRVGTLAAQVALQAEMRGAIQKAARNVTYNVTYNAPGVSSRAAKLFRRGTKIEIKRDARVYLTAPNIPKNDRLLEVYNADRPNRGRVQTRVGEATAVPGLLGIADQTYRALDPNGRNAQVYSLADAMRDAIWRKNTAARLKSLTASQNACAGGIGVRTPSIGLGTSC